MQVIACMHVIMWSVFLYFIIAVTTCQPTCNADQVCNLNGLTATCEGTVYLRMFSTEKILKIPSMEIVWTFIFHGYRFPHCGKCLANP